ncbi:MAG: SCO family protein [Paracoccaceae bacterium]|nr:SCO family protein [Paracoccaceae bacterium]MDE3240201.1 SCO family protein [Paracoccaceae bacterium]
MTRAYAATAAASIVILLGALGYFALFDRPGDPFAKCRTAQVAGGAGAIGGPFTLVNEAGKTVTDKDVIKGPTLVYFGYTFCPDLCPVDNARNAEATDLLSKRGYDVTPVFISIDPKRDTPETMKLFTENLSSKMIGLTGTEAQVKAAAQEYHVYYKIQDPTQKDYLFDHSTFTYLMMPKFGFVTFFRRDVTPKKMADEVACYVDAARGA